LARSLSQEELAERAGLHRTYVSSLERGQRNVGLDNIHALARALGVSAAELLSEDT
jgi:transcriptional regulator with XRE-family HTH domain